MNAVGIFLKQHWQVIVIGIFGVILGVVLNNWARSYENKKFLDSLVSELTALQNKAKTQTLTPEEQKQMDTLNTEIFILKFKCK